MGSMAIQYLSFDSLYICLNQRRAPEVRHDLFVVCEFDHPYIIQF